MPIQTAAKPIGVSRQTLRRIIAGTHPVTRSMAPRLGKLRGNGSELWLNMQQAFDPWYAEREMAEEIARIRTRGGA